MASNNYKIGPSYKNGFTKAEKTSEANYGATKTQLQAMAAVKQP